MKEITTLGRAIKSSVIVMGELGPIGEEVLAAHNINEIDLDAIYPGRIRQQIQEAAYQRFGSEALFNFGFSMVDYFSYPTIDSVMPAYNDEIKKTGPSEKSLDLFIRALQSDLDRNTKLGHKHEEQDYGVEILTIGAGIYEINFCASFLPHHESLPEGIMHRNLVEHISADWGYKLTFLSDKTSFSPVHSVHHWNLTFTPKEDRTISSRELLVTFRLQIKEKLLKKVLEVTNHSLALVMSSVKYASRLQRGQLPRQMRIDGRFASFGVIWEPRDTIGGDLYWLSSSQELGPFVLAVADCTGHGVPGAMLSLLVSNSLERIYANDTLEDPATALMSLDRYVRTGLNQDRPDSESDDGCDAAVLRIDRDKHTIEFAGAKLGLFQVTSKGAVIRYLGSRCSLGYQEAIDEANKPALQTIKYQTGDVFAVVTDGFTDQVGGTTGKISYGYRRLEEILKTHCAASAEEIASAMKNDLKAWQGEIARRDDVTAVVFKLNLN
jgi:serine phosphatase RsbU (regulator of sigma subunit)